MCECVYVGGEAGVKEAEGVENLKLNTQRQLKQWQERTPATTPTSRGYNYYFSVFTMLLVSFFFHWNEHQPRSECKMCVRHVAYSCNVCPVAVWFWRNAFYVI